MGKNTKVEWATHTFNPWRGCTKVSAGCTNCYADAFSSRNPKVLGVWGPNGTRVVAAEAAWKEPLKWNREAKAAGERHRAFCASLADVFEDWQGPMVDSQGEELSWDGINPVMMQDVRRRLFELIDSTPNLDWLLVTKRPENIARMMPENFEYDHAASCELAASVETPVVRHNVWLGTSVENQQAADERIPHLLKAPARVRFLSCEPLLGPVEFSNVTKRSDAVQQLGKKSLDGIHWVIVGGESGPHARPMHPKWARSLRDQCKAVGVAFHFKQWGEYFPTDAGDGCWASVGDKLAHTIDEVGRLDAPTGGGQLTQLRRIGKDKAGRVLDGRTWDEVPS